MDSRGTYAAMGRAAAISLMTAAVLSILAMSHHPTSAHGTGGIGGIVHGAMIVVLGLLLFGFVGLALQSGIGRPIVLAGLVAYSISAVANVGAATINGFVVPTLAARGSDVVTHEIFVLCWEANQALAKLGVSATGVAFLCWGADFLRRSGVANRLVGALGVLAAVLPAAALLRPGTTMDVPTAFAMYTAHAAFSFAVGVQLLRRKA